MLMTFLIVNMCIYVGTLVNNLKSETRILYWLNVCTKGYYLRTIPFTMSAMLIYLGIVNMVNEIVISH